MSKVQVQTRSLVASSGYFSEPKAEEPTLASSPQSMAISSVATTILSTDSTEPVKPKTIVSRSWIVKEDPAKTEDPTETEGSPTVQEPEKIQKNTGPDWLVKGDSTSEKPAALPTPEEIEPIHHPLIDQAITETDEAFERELKKGVDENNLDYLHHLAMQLLYLHMLRAGRTDHDLAAQKARELVERVKDIKGTYNNKLSLAFRVVSAFVSVVAAGGAFASFLGGRLLGLSATTQRSWGKFATPGSQLATALNFSSITDEIQQGKRVVLQNEKDTLDKKDNNIRERKGREETDAEGIRRAISDQDKTRHDTFGAIVG